MPLDDIMRALDLRPPRVVAAPTHARRAAVALVVGPGDQILFIRRAERLGDPWSGHMALPGGRVDPEDADVIAAAVRETQEEVGLALQREAHLLGHLDELASPPRLLPATLVVHPMVFAIDHLPPLLPNEEVARTYWFGLDRFLSGEGRGTMSWPLRGSPVRLPVVHLEDANIWGMTLKIVDDLLDRIREGRPLSR